MARERILIVDDEANARTALAELLRDEGYSVETAADGFKALPKLEDFSPDVVVTDLKMPGLSGLELMAKVRHLPVMRGEEIVGILSDRDVLAAGRQWLGNDSELGRRVMVVADAMSTRVSTITVDRPATEAAKTLLRRRVGALPVLRGRELRGMLAVSDFMYWILARA